MPTKAELDALLANCDAAWTTVNGIKGRKLTGKGDYASNSIFLPAAGYNNNEIKEVVQQNVYGDYWPSTPFADTTAHNLRFGSGGYDTYANNRREGHSVRAVLAE